MAIKKTQRGFALLIGVILVSIMLTFGLQLGALAYKQQRLVADAAESQHAFYAADTAIECALYADQQQGLFAYPATQPATGPAMTCDGAPASVGAPISYTNNQWVVGEQVSVAGGSYCANVVIYKPRLSTGTTYLFSEGYNAPCSTINTTLSQNTRIVTRGLESHY